MATIKLNIFKSLKAVKCKSVEIILVESMINLNVIKFYYQASWFMWNEHLSFCACLESCDEKKNSLNFVSGKQKNENFLNFEKYQV
jgi:hypothetical protein